MVSILTVKLRRDIACNRWQFGAVLVTIIIGVVLFATSYDAYRNLQASYNAAYERLAFADMTITGGGDADYSGIDGVADIHHRTQAEIPVDIGNQSLLVRLVGMPAYEQPPIDAIDIVEGRYLQASGEAVAEVHLADTFGLHPGDRVVVNGRNGAMTLDLVGVASSAEYIWPARSRQDLFPDPDEFGVLFIAEAEAAAIAAPVSTPQTLLRYTQGADRETVDAEVSLAAVAAGAGEILTKAEHPSNATLQLDVEGFGELAVLFPLLFLTAAGMAVFVLLTRIVYSQRGIIGILRASGVGAPQVRRHYLGFGLLLGGVGGVIGTVVGMVAGVALTGVYTAALAIPDTVVTFHWATPIVGIGFGVVAGSAAAYLPAAVAQRTSPAAAMRASAPQRAAGPSLLERMIPPLRRIPVRAKLVLRSVGRARSRSVSTIVGVVLAIVLVLASWGMIDSVQVLIDRQFNEIALQDAEIVFGEAPDTGEIAAVADVTGVAVAEHILVAPTSLAANGFTYSTQVYGLAPDTPMHGWPGTDGLPASGILVGSALSDLLAVDVGDTVTMTVAGGTGDVAIAGFVDEPLATFAYMDRAALREMAPGIEADPRSSIALARFDPGADRHATLDAIGGLPGVALVRDSRGLFELINSFLGFFYAFVGIMLIFGGVMAFSLMFNTISVNVAERSVELATMKANGMRHRTIAWMVAGENLFLTAVGIVPGLFIGRFVAGEFMAQYSSDLFRFELQLRASTLLFTALAMLAIAVLSLLPGLRRIKRLDVAAVVRERSV